MGTDSFSILKGNLGNGQMNLMTRQHLAQLCMETRSKRQPMRSRNIIWHIQHFQNRGKAFLRHHGRKVASVARARGRQEARAAGLRGSALLVLAHPAIISYGPRKGLTWWLPVAQELIQVKASNLTNHPLEILAPLL